MVQMAWLQTDRLLTWLGSLRDVVLVSESSKGLRTGQTRLRESCLPLWSDPPTKPWELAQLRLPFTVY